MSTTATGRLPWNRASRLAWVVLGVLVVSAAPPRARGEDASPSASLVGTYEGKSVTHWMKALEEAPDWMDRMLPARALTSLGEEAGEACPLLLRLWKEEQVPRLRRELGVAAASTARTEEHVRELVRRLRAEGDGVTQVRIASRLALGVEARRVRWRALLDLAMDPGPVRLEALSALSILPPESKGDVAVLESVLEGEEIAACVAAADTLAAWGALAPRSSLRIRTLLSRPLESPVDRTRLAAALARGEDPDGLGIETLRRILSEARPGVPVDLAVVERIGPVGSKAAPLARALLPALDRPNPAERARVWAVIRRIGTPAEAREALTRDAAHESPPLRCAVLGALTAVPAGTPWRDALLKKLARDESREVRVAFASHASLRPQAPPLDLRAAWAASTESERSRLLDVLSGAEELPLPWKDELAAILPTIPAPIERSALRTILADRRFTAPGK